MGFGAAPFGEAVDNAEGDFWSRADRIEPGAERGHEEGPNKEDSGFLAQPDVASVLVLTSSGAVRIRLLLPVDHHIADGAVARSVFGDPAVATHGLSL